MRRRIATVAVMAVMASGAGSAFAPAQAAEPRGRWCSDHSNLVGYALMSGGPLVSKVPGELVALKCTLQFGPANSQHWGADTVVATSGAPATVAVVQPTLKTYPSPASNLAFVCSEATIAGVTYYYDAATNTWSTSNAVDCDSNYLALPPKEVSQAINVVLQLVNDVFVDHVDPAICPVLASVLPPDGDIPSVYDCPPYGNAPDLYDDVVVPTVNTIYDQYVGPIYDQYVAPIYEQYNECTALGLLAPGVPGIVDIDPTGDVSLFDILLVDCPPYAS